MKIDIFLFVFEVIIVNIGANEIFEALENTRVSGCANVQKANLTDIGCCLKCSLKSLCNGINYNEEKKKCELCNIIDTNGTFTKEQSWKYFERKKREFKNMKTRLALQYKKQSDSALNKVEIYEKKVIIKRLTICTWFKVDLIGKSYRQAILTFSSKIYKSESNCNHYVMVFEDNHLWMWGPPIRNFKFSFLFPYDEWHHVCVTMDDNTFELFVNGSYKERVKENVLKIGIQSTVIILGTEQDKSGSQCYPDKSQVLTGSIYGMHVWDTVLNMAEINLCSSNIIKQEHLIADWDFFLNMKEENEVTTKVILN